MNFVHLQIGHVSRSTGRSSVQSVAYITGTKLVEDRRGIIADYRNVRGRNSEEAQEVFYQTLVPEGSGIDPKDLSGIWNKFENYEDEYAALRYKNPETQAQYMANARTAQTYIAALPKELPQEQNIELVREFTKKRFVDQGLVATYAIHWEKGNPHAHIQVSTRTVWNGEISWTKEVSRELASPTGIRETRILFAEIINEYQERAGILHKVDPRSFAERGIDLLPTRHKGYMAHQLEREGKYSRIVADNVQISEENKAKIADNPQIILKELTSKQATFSELDVVRLTQQRLKDDSGILSEYVIDAVMKEAVAVGIGIDNVNRYTSKEYFAKEEKILASLANYGSKQAAIPIDTDMVEQYIDAQSASEDIKFNEGQKNAIRTLCGNNQLSVMVGRAGTGKTTALKAVVDLHLQAGYEVWGMAPSATAAHELWKGAGCTSDTIAHHAYHWHKYHETVDDKDQTSTAADIAKLAKRLPDSKTLILVDEVGMVGVGGWDQEIPGGWDALTKTIDMTGSKLITVLDNHQFKPVDAGDIGRIVVERARAKVDATPLCELVDIIRQHTPWMKEASNQLAQLNTATALEMYDAQGHIQEHKTAIEVYEDMAGQYLRNITRDPSSQGIVLAATNEECQKLNREIRGVLKTNGLLPQEDSLTIGEDGYAVGDKIVFTKNDRNFNTKLTRGPNLGLGSILDQIASLVDGDDSKFFVRNGLQAVIESIKPCRIRDRFAKDDAGKAGFIDTFEIVARVENEDGRPPAEVRHPDKVRFYLHNYREFTHGYAVTGHKSQGMTLDWSLVKLSKFMDAYALYVILTRHRYDTSVYYAKEDFPDFASLIRSVGKVSRKDLAIDYTIPDESKEYWWNVQDYKTLRAEMASIAALGRAAAEQSEREEIWRDYRRTKAEIVDLAKIILGDRDNHRDFIRQAGLTFETLEIAAGLRKRPLSRLEVEACLVVEQYAAAAVESRELWNIIRRTHPGRLAKSHPEWENFEQARDKRGVLANQIAYNPVLYQSFLKETAENLGRQSPTGSTAISYSMRTVQSQAEAHQSKMLQQAMLKETGVDGRHTADPLKHEMLKTLIGYVDARDFSGAIWKELSPKLKEFEGTLLKDSFSKAIDEFTEMRILRDSMAFKIIEKREDYETLALKIGIKLDFEKLADQATQAKRDTLFKAYMAPDSEIEVKLKAAFEINALMQAEGRPPAEGRLPVEGRPPVEGRLPVEALPTPKKITVAQVYNQGLHPKDIALDAAKYQRLKVFEGLATEPERQLFTLLDKYNDQCQEANQIYVRCLPDIKVCPGEGREPGEPRDPGLRRDKPWNSSHYPAYKAACDARNQTALKVFNQRNHDDVLKLADAMGIKFKEVELEGIFVRCEQATRNAHIQEYLTSEDKDKKGQAAVDLLKLIDFERNYDKQQGNISVTARQAYYAGVDLKTLQATAFKHQREKHLQSLTAEEVKIFHALQDYEEVSGTAKKTYVACLEEAKTKACKPWETITFKDYLTLVTKQDLHAHKLLKESDTSVLSKVAQGMAISLKGLDVEAHRHSLRDVLQTFTEGDHTNVPLAAYEILNWLEFDRHADFKHTFKVLREQNLFPKDIKASLEEFHDKKRVLRHETEKQSISIRDDSRQGVDHRPRLTYTRSPSFAEVEEQLKDRMEDLATAVVEEKLTRRTSTQLRFGNNGSINIFISGDKKGLYSNYEAGIHGGPLKLIEVHKGLSSRMDACVWASNWLGGNFRDVERPIFEKQQEKVNGRPLSTWTPVVPVPASVADPDIAGNKYLNVMLSDGGKETGRYAYRDINGNLKGYVVRIERPDPDDPEAPKKITPPLAYCENQRGFKCWRWQGFETKNRTPYGLEKLARDPHKPILVVEGEKKADKAQRMLPEYHVLGWGGGAGSVGNTNWEPLVGRTVAIWPDNDDGGFKAADKLQKIVTQLNAEQGGKGTIDVVAIPSVELPATWDLADTLPKGWTVDTVRQMIKEVLSAVLPAKSIHLSNGKTEGKTEIIGAPPRLADKNRNHSADLPKYPVKAGNEILLVHEKAHQEDTKLESAVREFISLSKEHAQKPGKFSPKEYWHRNEINKSLSRIAAPYLKDERFLAKVADSHSKEAADRLAREIQSLNRTRDRGIDM